MRLKNSALYSYDMFVSNTCKMIKNNNYYSISIALYIVLLFLITGCGQKLSNTDKNATDASIAESSTLKNISRSKKIKVGTTADFMPFSYKTDAINSYSGIDIAMANDFAKSLSVQVEFVETSWPTLMSDLKEGKFDIGMSGITITPDRKKQAFFSVPVYSSGKVAITRDENTTIYNSIDNINKKGVRVIFNPGGTNESFARTNFPKAKLILNDDNLSIFQKLVDKEADVMVTDAIETMIQERVHKELDAVNLQQPFNSFDFGYIIRKDSIFKTVLDKWLVARKSDSIVVKLLQKEIEKLD